MKKSKAFTLVELLVVISIISFLSSIVLASLNTSREKARIAKIQEAEASLAHSSDVVLSWNFDEDSGSTADLSGMGHTGIVSGTTVRSSDTFDNKNKSLSLATGVGKIISTNNVKEIEYGNFAVSFWVKASTPPAGQTAIIDAVNGSWAPWGLRLGIAGGNSSLYWLLGRGGGGSEGYVGNKPLYDNKWHHVIAQFEKNGSISKFTYYIDGEKSGSININVDPDLPLNSLRIQAGNDLCCSWGSPYYSGFVDNVRVYAETLSTAEVEKIYAAEKYQFIASNDF